MLSSFLTGDGMCAVPVVNNCNNGDVPPVVPVRDLQTRAAAAESARAPKRGRVDDDVGAVVLNLATEDTTKLHAKIVELERAKAASDARADAAVAEAMGLRAQLKRQSDTEDMSDHAAMTLYEVRETIKAFVSVMTDIVAEVGKETDRATSFYMHAHGYRMSTDASAEKNAEESIRIDGVRMEVDALRVALTTMQPGDVYDESERQERAEEVESRCNAITRLTPALHEVVAMMKANMRIDPRIPVAFRDQLNNIFLGCTDSLANRVVYNISCEAFQLRYFTFGFKDMLEVGDRMAREQRPTLPKHIQYVGGAFCLVNSYLIDDLARMHDTIRAVALDHQLQQY